MIEWKWMFYDQINQSLWLNQNFFIIMFPPPRLPDASPKALLLAIEKTKRQFCWFLYIMSESEYKVIFYYFELKDNILQQKTWRNLSNQNI